jgi:rifampicin phosphotransferase
VTVPPAAPGQAPEHYVLPLTALDRTQLGLVGGKAANLGEMINAGLPVPPGFCVTTSAYGVAAERATGLRSALGRIGGERSSAQAAAPVKVDETILESAAADARAALSGVEIPKDIAAAIEATYRQLGGGDTDDVPVAVRSSATAEDLPGASFAGQQDTYLNVVGTEALLDAVRRCWASLWTERAVSYRVRNNIDQYGVKLAVVVQVQIQSVVAGVMFTANPVTGKRRQAVIDASLGLGEAVVSGAVTPDHFVVDTATSRVLERHLGDKRLRIESMASGGTRRIETPVGASDTAKACVSDEQLKALAELAQRVERYYGAPQDTEWAIDADGKLWLLQSRPVTTLYPLPERALTDDTHLRVYFSFNVAQGVYQPLTPMGLQAFGLMGSAAARLWGVQLIDPVAGPPVMVDAGHRLYLDVTAPLCNPLGRMLLLRAFEQMEPRSAQLLETLVQDSRLRRTHGSVPRSALRLLGFAGRSGIARGVFRALIAPDRARRRVLTLLDAKLRSAELPTSATASERLDRVTALPFRVLPHILAGLVPLLVSGMGAFFIAQRLLRDVASPTELDTVRRGLANNPTTEMDLELWRLAQRIRADAAASRDLTGREPADLVNAYLAGTLPPVIQRGLGEFLSAYGHRGVAEIDLGVPHWGDDPGHILGVLRNYLTLADPALAPDVQFARVAAEADALVRSLASRAGQQSRVRGAVVRFLLGRFRRLGGMREAPKFWAVRMLYAMRQLLAPVGQELVEAHRLDHSEDVYLLTLPEVRAALAGADVRLVVAQRRESMALESLRRRVPRLLLSDGSEPAEKRRTRAGWRPVTAALRAGDAGRAGDTVGMAAQDDQEDEETLEGFGASAGVVTGTARVILEPHGAVLQPGEILVAPSTDPGWTPLFLTAGGLVMEMGGPMSHGAIVAREYGIPAVVGVAGAIDRIKTGQTITVDGSAGTVSTDAEQASREKAPA